MAKRPRSARIAETSETIHLVARTHDDDNRIVTLCGYVEEGIWTGGSRVCENCRQTFDDLEAAVRELTATLAQPVVQHRRRPAGGPPGTSPAAAGRVA
jgi:hypothetical protein